MPEQQVFIHLIPSGHSASCNEARQKYSVVIIYILLQESMKSKSVNPSHRAYYQCYPSQVIFRHGVQFLRG